MLSKIMLFIRKFIATWQCMDTTFMHQNEMHRLLIRAATRCAYDLQHAASAVYFSDPDSETMSCIAGVPEHRIYSERAEQWIKIFDPKGVKDYRDSLHFEIYDLESKVDKLKKKLQENGIDIEGDDDIPF